MWNYSKYIISTLYLDIFCVFHRFSLKLGIPVAAAYATIDYGVWDDSETTTALFNQIQSQVKPYVKPYLDQIPFEAPTLPKAGDVVSTGKVMWNKGVLRTFEFLTEVPDLTWEYSVKGFNYTYEKINEQLELAKTTSSEPTKES